MLKYLIIFTFLSFQVFSQDDKISAFENLKETYSKINSISFSFKSEENPGFSGKILAETGNKFNIDMPDRTIICDGKTIWNYSKIEKKVIVSDYNPNSKSFTPEGFFFNFTNNFIPEDFASENSSSRGTSLILTLDTKDKNNNVKSVKIWYYPKGYKIFKVVVQEPNGTQTWQINNLKLNPALDKKYFAFIPQKEIEIIDLR